MSESVSKFNISVFPKHGCINCTDWILYSPTNTTTLHGWNAQNKGLVYQFVCDDLAPTVNLEQKWQLIICAKKAEFV